MGRSSVILPKKLVSDPARMARAITNALNAQALAIKVDFEVTTQTWADQPGFRIDDAGPYARIIGTDDANYARLNEGTAPHTIAPRSGRVLVFRTPFQAKTVPNSISSGPGRRGDTTVIRSGVVHHPGTKARQWDKAIAKKHRRLFRTVMQRAIDAAID